MKLNQLAAKPQLIKFVLDDEEIVKEYGEAIEFWSWDRQPLDVFMKLANNTKDSATVINVVRDLILDEEGKPIIRGEVMLPSNILVRAIGKIVEKLGK